MKKIILFIFLCTFSLFLFAQQYNYNKVIVIENIGITSTISGIMVGGFGSIMYLNVTKENNQVKNIGMCLLISGGTLIGVGIPFWIIAHKVKIKLNKHYNRLTLIPTTNFVTYRKKNIPTFGLSLTFNLAK